MVVHRAPAASAELPPELVRRLHGVLEDDSARLAAALDGTTDVMEAVPASAAEQLEAAGWTVDSVPGYGNPFLMFNTTKAPFDNASVRQAIHMAIDKQTLIVRVR